MTHQHEAFEKHNTAGVQPAGSVPVQPLKGGNMARPESAHRAGTRS